MEGTAVVPWDQLPQALSFKEKAAFLAVSIKHSSHALPPSPVEHVLLGSTYKRRIWIKAGTIFIGREHRKGHQVVLHEGSAILITQAGKIRYDAVATLITDPGFITVAYALTHLEVSTHHPNPKQLTDVKLLEDEIFAPADELLELGASVQQRLLAA